MQADLFQSSSPVMDASRIARSQSGWLDRFSLTLRLDHLSIAAISALVLYVLVFSFGVEKGKRFALQELEARKIREEQISKELAKQGSINGAPTTEKKVFSAESAAVGAPLIAPASKDSAPATENKTAEESTPEALSKGRYTIQIITFKSKTLAEKEVEKLASKGHQGFVVQSGKFFQVCVDRFETTRDANQKLGMLRSEGFIPPDAYVRPLTAL